MTTATLFGIALAPLYAAIAQVESDRGATSANVYQLRNIYVDDVNRILIEEAHKTHSTPVGIFGHDDISSRSSSEKMMLHYWYHWGVHYQKKTGKPVTYEVLARIHNGGPLGWKNPETVTYWNRVAAVMATQTEADVEEWANGGAK